jgi:surface protein
MQRDIIFELYRELHLDGNALMAAKLVFSKKCYRKIRSISVEKPIIFTISTTNAPIKFRSELDKDSIIYWGDGSMTSVSEKRDNISHKYPVCGNYRIKIFGHRKDIVLPIETTDVESIGYMKDLSKMLKNCESLVSEVGSKWDTSRVTDMSDLFNGCTKVNLNVGRNWNTSKVTNMSRMFYMCLELDNNVGKKWDTSCVKTMQGMFFNCFKLNQNIGKNWNMTNIEYTTGMFYGCCRLNKPIGKKWTFSNIRSMSYMFCYCTELCLPIGKNWKISPLVEDIAMFHNCKKISILQFFIVAKNKLM